MTVRALFVIGTLTAVLSLVPAAHAAPPPNDDRTEAIRLGALPERVTGSTVDAQVESTDPGSRCSGVTNASVFYTFTAAEAGRVAVQLSAAGDLDAVVDVYRRTRSQLEGVACDLTDREGQGAVAFTVRKGEIFVIRVAKLVNSVAGTFTLAVNEVLRDARPPGTLLPAGGRRDTVNRILNPSDAWSVRLRRGVTYRINLSAPVDEDRVRCVRLTVYGPGTSDFEDDPAERRTRCGGYLILTPGPGEEGRYSLLVEAIQGRGNLPYNIEVAPAGFDDMAPGRFIRNQTRVRGDLRGSRIDVVDLYRFDVTRFSTLDLGLNTNHSFDLILLNDRGRRIECACGGDGGQEINRTIKPGRYFAAVRANGDSGGSYTLSRVSRAFTTAKLLANGAKFSQIPPGGLVRWGVRVSQGADGPVRLRIERFDPLAGWQFAYLFNARASNGVAVIGFTPPHVGRWRAKANFLGTRTFSPSETGYASVLVAGPLDD